MHARILVLFAAMGVAQVFQPAAATNCFQELASTRNYTLGAPTHITLLADGKSVLYLRSGPRDFNQRLYRFDINTGRENELITPQKLLGGQDEHLSVAEAARRERMRITARGFVTFDLTKDGKTLLLSLSGKLYAYAMDNGKVTPLPGTGWIAPKISPNGKLVAALKDGEIHVITLANGNIKRLTRGATETLRHGEAEFAAQEEMDRRDGFWWSPDSKSLAYEETDLSAVEMHYIADPLHPQIAPAAFRYPRAGTANAIVRLGVIAATGGNTIWLSWDNKAYPYLNRVVWEEHGPLTFSVMNRTVTEQKLITANLVSGKTRQIWTERDESWIELPEAGIFPRYLKDGSFLWASERSGDWQLEHHRADGSLIGPLTPANFRFDSLEDIDEETGTIIVSGDTERISRRLYRVALTGGIPTALTAERGLHSAVFADRHDMFVHNYNLADGQNGNEIQDFSGKTIARLPSTAEQPPFIPHAEYLRIADRDYDAIVVRPRNFDPTKKYPVILSEYTGPAAKQVWAAPRQSFDRQCMADRGYIVVTLDNRGVPGHGHDWLRAIKGNFIDVPLADQIEGVKALAQKVPQMDLTHTGVIGWSHGGYFAAMAALRRGDFFSAAVAGAPPVEWEDYDTYYTERYLGLPKANPEGYHVSNVTSYVTGLNTPLLIVSGATDDNVYFQNTMKLTEALMKAGKKYEQIVLPGTHMLADPALRAAESERVMEFFARNLQGQKSQVTTTLIP